LVELTRTRAQQVGSNVFFFMKFRQIAKSTSSEQSHKGKKMKKRENFAKNATACFRVNNYCTQCLMSITATRNSEISIGTHNLPPSLGNCFVSLL